MKRQIVVDGATAYVSLTGGLVAVVDAADAEMLSDCLWSAISAKTARPYARRSRSAAGAGGPILMHRVIVNAPDKMEVDHINGNTLDNRRSNLRVATKSQNQHNAKISAANKSGAKGVFAKGCGKKWTAQIRVNRNLVHLGVFNSRDDAANAYAEASKKYHGPFGRLG